MGWAETSAVVASMQLWVLVTAALLQVLVLERPAMSATGVPRMSLVGRLQL